MDSNWRSVGRRMVFWIDGLGQGKYGDSEKARNVYLCEALPR